MTYKIFEAIEYLQNLLEYDGSQDACLTFKMEATLLDKDNHNESHNGY